MLLRHLEGSGDHYGLSWTDLTAGAPTIIALARICSHSFSQIEPPAIAISPQAKTILFAAREKGVIEIRNNHNAFNSVQRFLAVHVETAADEYLTFKHADDPEQTVRFMEGFRQLCLTGLVMHQNQHEFSLTGKGFEVAATIPREEIDDYLAFGTIAGRQE